MVISHLERAKLVLSFYASTLWSSTECDEFQYICGQIWLMADDVAKKLDSSVLTEALRNFSDNENDDLPTQETLGLLNNSQPSDRLINPCASFRDLSNFDRITHNSGKGLCQTNEDKVIRRPVSSTSANPSFNFTRSKTTFFYDNPFDPRLFEGFCTSLKFSLIGTPVASCERNLFIERENTIQLIENNLLGYRLFVMMSALHSNDTKCNYSGGDTFPSKSDLSPLLNSWQLLLDIMTVPQNLLNKLTCCELKRIWTRNESPLPLAGENNEADLASNDSSAKSQHLKRSSSDRKEKNKNKKDRKLDKLSKVTSHSSIGRSNSSPFKKNSKISLAKKTRSKTNSLDSEPHSPCNKLKRVNSQKEVVDESGYLSSQAMHSYAELDITPNLPGEDESNKTPANLPSMNPLAKPFVYKQASSCEERIFNDQLANRSLCLDEPIDSQFCGNFFPAMQPPQFLQAASSTPKMPDQMKQNFERNLYQSCQLPINVPANNTQQISSNCQLPMNLSANNTQQLSSTMGNSRPGQHILVSAPVALPAPNQQPPLFINTNVASRCTWVPTQPLLLRPVNQTAIMPPSNIHLPQVQSQMLMQAPNQIPVYLMQSQNNKPQLAPAASQQYNSVNQRILAAPYATPINNAPQINNHQEQESTIGSTIGYLSPKLQQSSRT